MSTIFTLNALIEHLETAVVARRTERPALTLSVADARALLPDLLLAERERADLATLKVLQRSAGLDEREPGEAEDRRDRGDAGDDLGWER